MLTCVRCMEHYDPNFNSAKSCHIRIGTGSERPTLTAMSGSAHLVIRHGQQTDWMTSLNQIQRRPAYCGGVGSKNIKESTSKEW